MLNSLHHPQASIWIVAGEKHDLDQRIRGIWAEVVERKKALYEGESYSLRQRGAQVLFLILPILFLALAPEHGIRVPQIEHSTRCNPNDQAIL